MRPSNLKTKIFLDSGGADETKIALDAIGFLDGQTTNPSYFAKSNKVQERLSQQGKYSEAELLVSYKETVSEISQLLPDGSISVEVYADKNTSVDDMLRQAREMNQWIPNAHIKLPIIPEGLKAANQALEEGMRVNMTLCFSQEQAAAVYAATKGANKGDVFISPFVGRHFDKGRRGIDLIKNIIQMYGHGDGHVEVLTASLRSMDQFYAAIQVGTDIITAGLKYIQGWAEQGTKLPPDDFSYNLPGLESFAYQEFDLDKPWDSFNIQHEMTDVGIEKFVADWKALIQ